MFRNIVLAVSSLGLLVLLFVAYNHYMGAVDDGRGADTVAQLPPQTSLTTQPLRVAGAMDVPPGGKIIFTKYDERTGRATDMFMCQDWQTVPGTKNQIRVRGPELAVALPSGMVAHISAAEGEVAVDRIEEKDMRPQEGWLAGDVRIELDRETRPDRTPRAERPDDLLTIAADRLQFNLGSGELHTDSRLTVTSADFEIAGTGLHLVWNQGENRVDRLTIERGEQFVLYSAADLLGMRGPNAEGRGAGATTAPAATAPDRRSRRGTSYLCTLGGGVTAEQFQGTERIGGLTAEHVELLFDLGGASQFSDRRAATTAPQSAPAERNRLVVRWSGPLELRPAASPEDGALRRRRLTAVGNPVVMTRRDGAVHCGRVDFHEDTQRVWLYPAATGTVDLGLGEKLSATAESIFIDRGARIVKLIGDVELRSLKGAANAGSTSAPVRAPPRASSIRCAYWAELHLAPEAPATAPAELPGELAGGDPLAAGQLESAIFVGEVEVRLGQPALTAHRLDVTFQPGGEGRSLEELLDRAWANGDVQLTSGDGRISAANLEFVFDLSPSGALYPQQMQAVGAVQISSGKASVTGSRVLANLAPPADDEAGERGRFFIRELHVLGQAELIDPVEKRAARGDEIVALFGDENRLRKASVVGSSAEWALVHAQPYTVRGERIELDAAEWTLGVEGPARLSLKTRRSLQGGARRRPVPIIVTSQDALHIDGRGNRVRFTGDVVARSEGEQIRGDVLTLVLEDAEPQAPVPGAEEPGFRELWRQARRLLGGAERSTDRLFVAAADDEPAGTDKEPRRVLVENALVTSEAQGDAPDQPLMHASISAPQLEIDIPNRQIVTTGLTELLLTDRRGVADPETARVALGVPSALVSKGPHQTAMRCTGRMVYTLGPDGPGRRDTVVFEDQVVFVHRTGRDMVNFEQMLPAGADAAAASALRSRNAALDCGRLECWFAADERGQTLEGSGGLTRTPLRLTSLIASGSVYLRDVEDRQVREVNAAWVEFDAEASRIRVRGSDTTEARVYFEDQDGQVRVTPGRQIEVNLQDGTIRSDRIQGEFRRG